MVTNSNSEKLDLPVRKCPHLGLFEDNKTWAATDVLPNFCHLQDPPLEVDWKHQRLYCFNDAYVSCPILLKGAQALHREKKQKKLSLIFVVTLSIVGLIGIGIILWLFGVPSLFIPASASAGETPQAAFAAETVIASQTAVPFTSTATFAPTVTLQPTSTAVPTLTPQPSSTATIVMSPTAGPALMTPFGASNSYVVHQVRPGESLELLAIMYSTNETVLRAVNGLTSTDALWADRILVVRPGVTNDAGVQKRTAVLISDETTVQELATQYRTTVNQLRADNGLGSSDTIPANRWIVVP